MYVWHLSSSAIQCEEPTLKMRVLHVLHASKLSRTLHAWSLRHYTIYGLYCHMRNSVTYPILRRMLGCIDD